ncbi:MAG: hypothetical protein JWP41_330 [Ramlibacter sp.]|nr:hypothetical protein [Ramlibacter sp.]
MPSPLIAALCFTVALLVTTGYFILGSIPLLILTHDTPLDSRFVRGFFNIYYVGAMITAAGTAVSYALAGKPVFGAGAAALALLAAMLRRKVIPQMDSLRSKIELGEADAIARFRRTHLVAILINLAQLVLIVWSLTTFSL